MRKQPEPKPTFFVDVDLGPRFYGRISSDARFNVEFHNDHFPSQATDDSEWLGLVAENGWIGVTHDKKIRRDHQTIIKLAGAQVIIVVGDRAVLDHADNFLVTYPKIARFVRKHKGPYTAKVYHPTPRDLKKLKPTGRIEMWGDW